MTYSEIYKILSFEKQIDHKKIIMSTKNNLTILSTSAKQQKTQI
jgi:hypothetical protein